MSALVTQQLTDCESRIERNLQGFYEVGKALAEIRDERLYHIDRGGEFETFEKYCRERWGWEKTYVHYITNSAQAVDDVHHGELPKPENERQARELSRLPEPEERRAAWKEAVETAPQGKVTAAHVREVVNKRTGEVIDPADIEVVKVKDLGPSPQQRSEDDPARRWAELFHKVYAMLNSLRDLGGIKKLATKWGKSEKQSNIKEIRRLIERLEKCAAELE